MIINNVVIVNDGLRRFLLKSVSYSILFVDSIVLNTIFINRFVLPKELFSLTF